MRDEPNARAILAAVLAVFFAFMGIGVVDPILPVIADEMGAAPWETEMLFTSYLAIMAVAMLFVAPIPTRIGSRRTMLFALAGVVVFAGICGLISEIWPLAIARGGWGLSNAFFTPTALALILLLAPSTSRAVTFFEAGLGLGIACGPLLGGFLGGISYHLPFFGTPALVLIGLIATLIWVKEPARREQPQPVRAVFRPFSNAPFVIVSICGMLYYYSYFTVLTYSPLFLHLDTVTLGLIFFGWGVMVAIGSVWLVNRLQIIMKPTTLLIASLAVMVVSLGIIIAVDSLPLRIALLVLIGLPSGVCNAVYTVLSVDVSPHVRSVSTGAYNFLRWIGSAFAPVLSGILSAVTPVMPYEVAAVLVVICAVVLFLSGSRINRAQAEATALRVQAARNQEPAAAAAQ